MWITIVSVITFLYDVNMFLCAVIITRLNEYRKNMPQNKIKDLFDNSPGNTVYLKKECSELTGINIRTIQMYYSDRFKMPSMNNVIKLRAFFSQKLGREIDIDEIIVARNYVVKRSVNTIIEKIESH